MFAEILRDVRLVLGVHARKLLGAHHLGLQVPVGVVRRVVRMERLLDVQRQERLEVQAGAPQRSEQLGLLGPEGLDPLGTIGPSRQRQVLADDAQPGVFGRDAFQGFQGAQTQHRAERLGVSRAVDVFVEDLGDVAAGALQEQGHRAVEVVFDHLRGEARKVGRHAAARNGQIRMAGEVVDHGQRPAVHAVDAEDADLGVDGPDAGDLVVRRAGIRVADRPMPAVRQPERPVHHDAVFVADARADLDGRHARGGPAHGVERSVDLFGVLAQEPAGRMGVRGVHQDVAAGDAQFLFDPLAELGQEVVVDVADAADRRDVHGDDDRLGLAVVEDEGLREQRVVDPDVLVAGGDIAFGHAGPKGPRGLGRR